MKKENLSWFDSNNEILKAFMADVRAKLSKHFPGMSFPKDKDRMVLSDSEVEKLVSEGNFDKVIECNLRLVIYIAHSYENLGPSLLDVIEEGCKGLVNAAHNYSRSQGEFVRVASRQIKEAIWTAYDEFQELPKDFAHVVKLVNEAKQDLASQYYCDVTDPELILELLEERFANKESVLRNLSLENVKRALNYGKATSIDEPTGNDEDNVSRVETISYRDINGEGNGSNADLRTENADTRKIAAIFLGMLNERDREIAKLHFGMVDGFEWGAEMIADKMGITTTRVNQVILALQELKDKAPSNLRQAC